MRQRAVSLFLTGTLLVVLLGAVLIFTMGHFEVHLWLNGCHGPLQDRVLALATNLADGITVTLVALCFLPVGWRPFLMVGLPAVISALITQLLKRTAFADVDRPVEFLLQMPGLPLVEGVTMNHHNSFPSGHTTAAFSMCLGLAVVIGRPRWALVLCVVATLLGFSRIHLSQHFLEDVVVGAVIGTITAWAVYRWLYGPQASIAPWLDRRPFDRK